MGMSGVKDLDGRVGVRDMPTFDPLKIKIEKGFNPRVAETLRANVDRLKPMIEAVGGVLQPLWVRRDGEECVLIDGESRLTAVRELLKEGKLPATQNGKPFGVPVLHMAGAADERQRLILAMTANGGAPLEKWEIGKNYARLLNIGMTEGEIAESFGKTLPFVQSALLLNDASADVKHMLAMDEVSEGAALKAVKKFGSSAGEHLAQAPKNESGKVVREKATAKPKLSPQLLAAAEAIIAEWKAQKTLIVEVHSDNVRALEEAIR